MLPSSPTVDSLGAGETQLSRRYANTPVELVVVAVKSLRRLGNTNRWLLRLWIALLVLVSAWLAVAQPSYAVFKDDFPTSDDYMLYRDEWPVICFDSVGNFVIVWDKINVPESLATGSGVDYARTFWSDGSPRTPTFLVMPDTMRVRERPCVASRRDGRFWVIFCDVTNRGDRRAHTYASQFDAAGNQILGPVNLLPDVTYAPQWLAPSGIDMSIDESRIVISLEEVNEPRLCVVQFDSLTNRIGLIQRLDSGFTSPVLQDVKSPVVSYGLDNHIVATFSAIVVPGWNPCCLYGHLLRRYFDSLTQPVGSLAVSFCGDSVDIDCASYAMCPITWYPQQVSSATGAFFATTGLIMTCNHFGWAYFQAFHFQGDSLSTPIALNDPGTVSWNTVLYPRIGTDGRGLYVVAWMDGRYFPIEDARADLFAQLVDSAGNKYGKNVLINSIPQSPGGTLNEFDVAIHDSQVVIAWSDYRNGSNWDTDIYCQMMELRDFVWFMPGDCDGSRDIAAADIIWLVNYVFKGGAWPQPRVESGDVNADCSISTADIIRMVNYVFKSGQSLAEGCAGY